MDDIDMDSLEMLHRSDVLALVDQFGDNACHHQESDVYAGDPIYYLGRCSACWRECWPVVQAADGLLEIRARSQVRKTVNETIGLAVEALRELHYHNPDGTRMPTAQDKRREDKLFGLMV